MYPKGLAKVVAEAPYLWVYLKLDQPERSSVAQQLRELGGPTWLDPEVRDRQPLGRYLRQDGPNRAALVRDAGAMADFAIGQFPEVLALEDLIKRVLPAV